MDHDDDWTIVVKNHSQQPQKQQPQQHTKPVPEKQKKSILPRPVAAAAMPLQPQPPKGIQQQQRPQQQQQQRPQQQQQQHQQQQQRIPAKQDTKSANKPTAKQNATAIPIPSTSVNPAVGNGAAGVTAGAGGTTGLTTKKIKAPAPSTKGVTLFDLMLFKKQPTMAVPSNDKEKKSNNVVASTTAPITTSTPFSSTTIANAMNNSKTLPSSSKFNIDEFKAKRFLVKKNKKKKLSVMKKRILMVCSHHRLYFFSLLYLCSAHCLSHLACIIFPCIHTCMITPNSTLDLPLTLCSWSTLFFSDSSRD